MSLFALADCNNFYASSERVFKPYLMNKPLIVLSNNDGCVIARSNEAKALGVPMGAPYFKILSLIKKHNIQVFSSNYTLYGLMSARVMRTLRQFTPHLEVYSIDEAFLDLSSIRNEELSSHIETVRKTVSQWTGIPISIGVAPTKTLAKVANKLAKTRGGGSCILLDPCEIKRVLADFPIEDVWGIGRRWAMRLHQNGIQTALDLSQLDPASIRKEFNVVLARTVLELKGISALKLEKMSPPKKSIISSRSFGKEVGTYQELSEAIAFHASKIGEKLRKQNSYALTMGCMISTSKYKPSQEFYRGYMPFTLPSPSQDTSFLIEHSLKVLERIYRRGDKYIRAGVIALDLIPDLEITHSLFEDRNILNKRKSLMASLDAINTKYGRGTLTFASEGISKSWSMKRNHKSPDYLSNWNEILCIS